MKERHDFSLLKADYRPLRDLGRFYLIKMGLGESLTVRQISAKRDEDSNPGYREDTVWWLLKLEDRGQVHLNEKELVELQK